MDEDEGRTDLLFGYGLCCLCALAALYEIDDENNRNHGSGCEHYPLLGVETFKLVNENKLKSIKIHGIPFCKQKSPQTVRRQ